MQQTSNIHQCAPNAYQSPLQFCGVHTTTGGTAPRLDTCACALLHSLPRGSKGLTATHGSKATQGRAAYAPEGLPGGKGRTSTLGNGGTPADMPTATSSTTASCTVPLWTAVRAMYTGEATGLRVCVAKACGNTPGAGGDCAGTGAPLGMTSGAGGTVTLPTAAAAAAMAAAALPCVRCSCSSGCAGDAPSAAQLGGALRGNMSGIFFWRHARTVPWFVAGGMDTAPAGWHRRLRQQWRQWWPANEVAYVRKSRCISPCSATLQYFLCSCNNVDGSTKDCACKDS